jgi:hypothetical protein
VALGRGLSRSEQKPISVLRSTQPLDGGRSPLTRHIVPGANAATCPQVCRFSAAGNDETLPALKRPAAEKRQGTKSREVGH